MRPAETGSPSKKPAPTLPKTLGGPVADAIRNKVKTGINTGSKPDYTRGGQPVGRPAPEEKYNPQKPLGPRPKVGRPAPEEKYPTPKPTGPRPKVGRPAPEETPKVPFKPTTDPVPGPGNRPAKPAPAATVYRAKKGDGLWQVAEKTKPAGVSTAAWWTKIKKLNSTNGKVNRTYTGTGVKLPKR